MNDCGPGGGGRGARALLREEALFGRRASRGGRHAGARPPVSRERPSGLENSQVTRTDVSRSCLLSLFSLETKTNDKLCPLSCMFYFRKTRHSVETLRVCFTQEADTQSLVHRMCVSPAPAVSPSWRSLAEALRAGFETIAHLFKYRLVSPPVPRLKLPPPSRALPARVSASTAPMPSASSGVSADGPASPAGPSR